MSLRRPLVLVNGLMRALPTGDRVPLSEIGARVRRTTNQSINTSTSTAISFDSARYNNGTLWSASNPTRLTIPVAGKYLIGGCLQWQNATTGDRIAALSLNGSTGIASQAGTGLIRINLFSVWDCAANDYIELVARQESGSSIDCLTVNNYSPELWAHRIGE